MGRLLSHLRRGLLGIAFAGSLGFGAAQALASPRAVSDGTCVVGDPGSRTICQRWCQEQGYRDGSCTKFGLCACVQYIGP